MEEARLWRARHPDPLPDREQAFLEAVVAAGHARATPAARGRDLGAIGLLSVVVAGGSDRVRAGAARRARARCEQADVASREATRARQAEDESRSSSTSSSASRPPRPPPRPRSSAASRTCAPPTPICRRRSPAPADRGRVEARPGRRREGERPRRLAAEDQRPPRKAARRRARPRQAPRGASQEDRQRAPLSSVRLAPAAGEGGARRIEAIDLPVLIVVEQVRALLGDLAVQSGSSASASPSQSLSQPSAQLFSGPTQVTPSRSRRRIWSVASGAPCPSATNTRDGVTQRDWALTAIDSRCLRAGAGARWRRRRRTRRPDHFPSPSGGAPSFSRASSRQVAPSKCRMVPASPTA